jgi:hypothetical protein
VMTTMMTTAGDGTATPKGMPRPPDADGKTAARLRARPMTRIRAGLADAPPTMTTIAAPPVIVARVGGLEILKGTRRHPAVPGKSATAAGHAGATTMTMTVEAHPATAGRAAGSVTVRAMLRRPAGAGTTAATDDDSSRRWLVLKTWPRRATAGAFFVRRSQEGVRCSWASGGPAPLRTSDVLPRPPKVSFIPPEAEVEERGNGGRERQGAMHSRQLSRTRPRRRGHPQERVRTLRRRSSGQTMAWGARSGPPRRTDHERGARPLVADAAAAGSRNVGASSSASVGVQSRAGAAVVPAVAESSQEPTGFPAFSCVGRVTKRRRRGSGRSYKCAALGQDDRREPNRADAVSGLAISG